MVAPLLLFAPGAGAPSTSAWMDAWAGRLAAIGTVERFDYPYAREGRKAPDKLPKLVQAHREALADARARHPGAPVVLIGKSMGSRVGCHLAVEDADAEAARPDGVAALVCLGYPLVAAGGKSVRDEVLLALRRPILFVQGSRDPLCPLDRLAEVRPRMTAPSELFVVQGGDHSLQVRKGDLKAAGTTQDDVDAAILAAIRRFAVAHA